MGFFWQIFSLSNTPFILTRRICKLSIFVIRPSWLSGKGKYVLRRNVLKKIWLSPKIYGNAKRI